MSLSHGIRLAAVATAAALASHGAKATETVISKEDCRTFHGFKNHPPEDEYCIDYIAIDSAHAGRVCAKESHVTTDIETSGHNPVFVTMELADE